MSLRKFGYAEDQAIFYGNKFGGPRQGENKTRADQRNIFTAFQLHLKTQLSIKNQTGGKKNRVVSKQQIGMQVGRQHQEMGKHQSVMVYNEDKRQQCWRLIAANLHCGVGTRLIASFSSLIFVQVCKNYSLLYTTSHNILSFTDNWQSKCLVVQLHE